MLASGRCPDTGRSFRQELPYDLGYLAPAFILDDDSVVRPLGKPWHAAELKRSVASRPGAELEIVVARRSTQAGDLVLVSCLRHNWGEALGCLLRVTAIRAAGKPVAVLIPSPLKPFVPDQVEEIWEVRQSASRNLESLIALRPEVDRFIREQAKRFASLSIPVVHQPAHLTESDCRNIFRIQPFPLSSWLDRLEAGPTVTLMWSETRAIRSPEGGD